MNRFSITFNSRNPMACPSCACIIDDRNIRFYGDIAFCHECRNGLDDDQLLNLAEIVCSRVAASQVTTQRGLVFFAPDDHLRTPLQPALVADNPLLFRREPTIRESPLEPARACSAVESRA